MIGCWLKQRTSRCLVRILSPILGSGEEPIISTAMHGNSSDSRML
jgi:hypothetical protein